MRAPPRGSATRFAATIARCTATSERRRRRWNAPTSDAWWSRTPTRRRPRSG